MTDVIRKPATWRRGFYRFRKDRLSVVGLCIIMIEVFMMIFAPLIAPYPQDATGAVHFEKRYLPPSSVHIFGTDDAGRDVLSRVIFGSRIDLLAALLAISIILAVGVPFGLIAGYLGGKTDEIIMGVADIILTLPPFVLALAAIAMFRPGLEIAILAVGLAWWPWYARVMEAVVLHMREEKFIEASKMIGKKPLRIVFEDIFPNTISILIVKSTFDVGSIIPFIAALSFLGLGAQAPTPSWGAMIGEARIQLPDVWWTSAFPGIFIFIAVLGFVLLGDGLRDSFDVRLQ